MSWLEFTAKTFEATVRYLSWPALLFSIFALFKHNFSEIIDRLSERLSTVKYKGIDITFGDMSRKIMENKITDEERESLRLKQIEKSGPYLTLYSNGIISQKLKISLKENETEKFIVFPEAFPNEIISIMIINNIDWNLKNVNLGNCQITFSPASNQRDIEIIITGI